MNNRYCFLLLKKFKTMQYPIKNFFLFCLILSIFSCETKDYVLLEIADSTISKLQKQFAPDKRTAWFQVEAKTDDYKTVILRGETTISEAKDSLLANLQNQKIPFIDSITVLPATDLENNHFGVVRLSVANIRSKPKHSAELATQALLGEQLRVWKKEGDWYFIQTPNNYFGWLDKGGFTLMDKTEFENWQKADKVIMRIQYTNSYVVPDMNDKRYVSDLVIGNILLDLGRDGNWAKVGYPDGREGYVPVRFRTKLNDWLEVMQPDTNNIVNTAKSMMGNPYLWGGTSVKGMDCSGFTKTVYFLNGIQLERDASLQVKTGIEIETDTTTWKNLQKGDLLFFGRKATPEKKERIWHVAIWMGGGKIIHAAELVKIESLIRDEPDFAEDRLKTFVRAKRIVNSVGKNGILAVKDSEYY